MASAEGTLTWSPMSVHPELVAGPVFAAAADAPSARVAEIDETLADTAAFCDAYDVAPAASANCVVVEGRRGERVVRAAVMVLATDRADINGVVRRHLGLRKLSFMAPERAEEATGMRHGGITPLGLPPQWPILVDTAVAAAGPVVIGAGIRRAKLLLPGSEVAALPGAEVLDLAVAR